MDKNKTSELAIDVFTVHWSESTLERFDSKAFKKDNEELYAKYLKSSTTKNGFVEHGNKEDPFHLSICRVTGKTSVKDLTKREMKMVESEIFRRTNNDISGDKVKNQEAVSGMMQPSQQSLAWRLMYQIRRYDVKISNQTVGARLAGIVRKTLEITASDTEPLKWVNAENGNILIEMLKGYVKSAEKNYKKQIQDMVYQVE